VFVEEIHFCNYGEICFGGRIVPLKIPNIKVYIIRKLFYCSEIRFSCSPRDGSGRGLRYVMPAVGQGSWRGGGTSPAHTLNLAW